MTVDAAPLDVLNLDGAPDVDEVEEVDAELFAAGLLLSASCQPSRSIPLGPVAGAPAPRQLSPATESSFFTLGKNKELETPFFDLLGYFPTPT